MLRTRSTLSRLMSFFLVPVLYKAIIIFSWFIPVVAVLLCYTATQGQTLTYQLLSAETGLPDDQVYYIMQDTKGFIWFATRNGVCRWDSRHFEYFTIENGLPNNEVTFIYEDAAGRIWFSCYSKELCYYYQGAIYNRAKDTQLQNLEIIPGSKLTAIGDELYYVTPQKKLTSYNSNTHTIHTYGKFDMPIWFYFFHQKDKLWVMDIDREKDSKFFSKDDTFSSRSFFQPNYPDATSVTAINYRNRMYSFQNNLDSPFFSARYTLPDFQWALFNKGNVLEIYKTMLLFRKTGYKLSVAYNGFPLLFALNDIFYLVTTKGLLSCKQVPILEYRDESGTPEKVCFLFRNKQKIYAIDAKFRIVDIAAKKQVAAFGSKMQLVYDLYTDSEQRYLVSPAAIWKMDDALALLPIPGKRENSNFKALTPGQKDNEFFSANGSNGLFRLNFKSGRTQQLFKSSLLAPRTVFEDHRYRLWFATQNKVYYTSRYQDTISDFREFILDPKAPLFCSQITEDRGGNIFFVTNGGVFVYDGQKKYRVDKSNLLTHNNCNKLLLDPGGESFWVATQMGLNHIRYTRSGHGLHFETINKFLETDGLHSNVINDLLLYNDRLYIATNKGVNILDDMGYRPPAQHIPVYITLDAINGRATRSTAAKDVTLASSQNNLSLKFSAVYFTRRDRLKVWACLYRNEKLISKNSITGDKIDYYSLSGGNYKLVLYACDQDYANIKGSSAPYSFTILVPYYKTWWFVGAMIFLLAATGTALLYFMMRRRKQRELDRLTLHARLNESNLKSLQSQMNPHFVFNSLNTLQHFITGKDEAGALDFLSEFSCLIREMLEQSVHNMISLERELHFLKQYIHLESIRFKHSFTVSWHILLDEELADIAIPTMLLQPILENAVKHGISHLNDRAGRIGVWFELQEENLLRVTIRDNGTTVHKPSHGNAIAIKVIRDRLSLYALRGVRGSYTLTLGNDGATAIITIPI